MCSTRSSHDSSSIYQEIRVFNLELTVVLSGGKSVQLLHESPSIYQDVRVFNSELTLVLSGGRSV